MPMQLHFNPTKTLPFWTGIVFIFIAYACFNITYSLKPFSRPEGFLIKVVFFAVIYYTGKFHIGPMNPTVFWLAKSWKYLYIIGAGVSLVGTFIRFYVKNLDIDVFNFFITVDMFLFSPTVYVVFAIMKIKLLKYDAKK
jgi:hypothetical protein